MTANESILQRQINKKAILFQKEMKAKDIILIDSDRDKIKVVFEDGHCFKASGAIVENAIIMSYEKKKQGFLF